MVQNSIIVQNVIMLILRKLKNKASYTLRVIIYTLYVVSNCYILRIYSFITMFAKSVCFRIYNTVVINCYTNWINTKLNVSHSKEIHVILANGTLYLFMYNMLKFSDVLFFGINIIYNLVNVQMYFVNFKTQISILHIDLWSNLKHKPYN